MSAGGEESAAARDREEPPRCSVGTALPHRSVLHVLFFPHNFCRVTYCNQKAICQEVGLGFLHIALRSVLVCLSVCRQHSSDHSTNAERTQITQGRSQTNAISVTLNLFDGVH